jgi:hypothetical protein
MMFLNRRMALLLPIILAGCGDDEIPREYPPLRYDYLTRLQLNVASISYSDLPPATALDQISPVPLAPALQRMAQDRLMAAGSSGRAIVTIQTARIVRVGGGLDGTAAIRLDVIGSDDQSAGFAEARVVRRVTQIGHDLRSALYDMTKQMLDDMNVEFEFQVRRTLRGYLETTTTAPTPAPVQQQDLSAPAPSL